MKMKDSPEEICQEIVHRHPEAEKALENSRHIKGQLLDWQAVALYCLAARYNREGANILEIGTLHGFSCSLIAQAVPSAKIITLNPAKHEIPGATANLSHFQNVTIVVEKSWDYLDAYDGPMLDMIFVDGDHKRAAADVAWWGWLERGGLMLFHDYSPAQCPPVYKAVNEMAALLGRQPDVLLMDTDEIGMAGFYRRG
jgi:predicted O-methyltransferase YrrM